MAILDIRINNRSYQIACDDGQETHVRDLGRNLDARVRDLSSRMGGQVADGTLLVLVALMLSDELNEANTRNKNLSLQLGNASQSFEVAKQTELELSLAQTISDITSQVENITQAIIDKPIAKA